MKNILVPVDFSKQSLEALKVAVKLAKKMRARVAMVHVLFTPVIYDTGLAGQPVILNPSYMDEMQKDVKKKLDKVKSKLAEGVSIKSEVLFGEIGPSIADSIERYGSDLVVIGSSDLSSKSGLAIGSITERIVRHSPVPVLTVWKSFEPKRIKDILLPSTLDLDQTDFIKEVKKCKRYLMRNFTSFS